ncbi:hypothetical protein ZIOFF_011666 [Zingiber officinale]|uniref:C2 NT-type domain-containing protein n=1 Tax=Zingiber officinale TaxID=94328 RepID=A0A8J5HKT3_ZINOF|nr:hypothetical protein ZIOFF_011666 [Zingiber officinale]
MQVPKGWDKLFLSIVSVESGKTIAKTGKATVRSGNCQWTEAESIWVSQDDTSKELEESQIKIVISPASARSVIIGEVTLNLEDFLSAGDTGPLFLPLQKCDSGTTLQVKVQSCSPISKFRVGKSLKETSHFEEQDNDAELDSKHGSDNIIHSSTNSSSRNQLGYTYADDIGNRIYNITSLHLTTCYTVGNHILELLLKLSSYVDLIFCPQPDDLDLIACGQHESLRSNQSSFSSSASSSSLHNQWEDTNAHTSERVVMGSSRPSDSSKDLLQTAEETEELRDEVKMWEGQSQQLKLDLESLKEEISEKAMHQANLDKQLSATKRERDSLLKEVEQLKVALENSMSKQTNIGSFKNENSAHALKELEDELKFHKESNANLAQQLKQAQDSNIEFVSILQELEEITEKQNLEIASLSQQSCLDGQEKHDRIPKSLDNEAECRGEMLGIRTSNSNLEIEIETLKNKIQELESDCAELTEENLDMMYKLKDAGKGSPSQICRSKESRDEISDDNCKYGNVLLKSRARELEDELKRKEATTATLSAKFKDLENVSADLEIELQHYKDKTSDLEANLCQMHKEIEEKNFEISNLHKKLKLNLENDYSSMQIVLSEMNNQVSLALAQAKSLHLKDSSIADKDFDCNCDENPSDILSQKSLVEDITKSLFELNSLLKKKETKSDGNREDEIQSTLLLKEQEIDRLKSSSKELEDLISILQQEKFQLEEDLTSLQKQNDEMSKLLEDVENDLEEITGSMEFHVSANKNLEKKTEELQNCKMELELQNSEIEHENIKLSERVAGLEAQLRFLTNEKESYRLELEDTRSLVVNLKDDVEQHKGQMEMQKSELKQKVQETQKQLSEALEESDVSRRSNSKLAATIENLMEECRTLQTLIGDLKRQKTELHQQIIHLEVELSESRNKNFDFHDKVDVLESKLSSLQKEIASKEKALLLQLDRFLHDLKEHEEKVGNVNILLKHIEIEKTLKVENLEKEITNLTSQMSVSEDDRENLALDAVHEASVLCADKARLECSLQEISSKAKFYEADLQAVQKESKSKIQGLVDLLNASKQSEEMLMADIEQMKQVLGDAKSNEQKHRKIVYDLELKNKTLEYEKQQTMEEISELKFQLQKLSHLQNTILALENSLDEANCEKRKLKELLKSATEEHEELMSEKVSLTEKISNMDKTLCDSEDDRRRRIALQEQLMRLENLLSIKDASCSTEVELKNELNQFKRINSEYHRKIQNLEEENLELTNKVRSMESQDEITNSENEKVSPGHIQRECASNKVVRAKGQTESSEANNTHKDGLIRGISQSQSEDVEALKKVINDHADKISSLESELKDIREKYLHMSLQYAEVAAEREELVMQLKSAKKERRWFS